MAGDVVTILKGIEKGAVNGILEVALAIGTASQGPFSRPSSWRECVGVEPTSDWEASPATVLKNSALYVPPSTVVSQRPSCPRQSPPRTRQQTSAAHQRMLVDATQNWRISWRTRLPVDA
jgi:hypothetical protein